MSIHISVWKSKRVSSRGQWCGMVRSGDMLCQFVRGFDELSVINEADIYARHWRRKIGLMLMAEAKNA